MKLRSIYFVLVLWKLNCMDVVQSGGMPSDNYINDLIERFRDMDTYMSTSEEDLADSSGYGQFQGGDSEFTSEDFYQDSEVENKVHPTQLIEMKEGDDSYQSVHLDSLGERTNSKKRRFPNLDDEKKTNTPWHVGPPTKRQKLS
eukprot:928994_1